MTGSLDKSAKLWDLNTGFCLRTLDYQSPITSVALSSCGEKELINSLYKDVFLFTNSKSDQSKQITEITNPGNDVTVVSMSMNGVFAVTGSIYGDVKLINLQENSIVKDLYKHNGRVTAVDMSQDLKYILTGSSDRTATLLSVDYILKGHKIYTMEHEEPITAVSISTDSK